MEEGGTHSHPTTASLRSGWPFSARFCPLWMSAFARVEIECPDISKNIPVRKKRIPCYAQKNSLLSSVQEIDRNAQPLVDTGERAGPPHILPAELHEIPC